MSVISEKVRKALFAKLDTAAVVGTGKATAVYESKAPENASLPYVVFNRQAPGEVQRTFGATFAMESDLWLLKALADEDSSKTKEPQELAEDILILCETAIGGSLTLSGNTVVWCERFADMPPLEETQVDRHVYIRGFLLRVATE